MKKDIIMIVIIILIILGVVSGVVYLAATNDEPQQELDVIETSEVNIDDSKIKDQLSESLIAIKYLGENRRGATVYNPELSGKIFDDASKLSTIFINDLAFEKEQIDVSDEDVRYFLDEQGAPNEVLVEVKKILKAYPVKLIDEIYERTYGKRVKKESIFENGKLRTDSCPNIGLSEDKEKYLVAYNCTGGNSAADFYYEYKFTETNKHAYVYVAVAYLNYENKIIYKDYNLTNEYSSLTDEIDPGKTGVNFINNDNYNEFSKYKVSFVKENDKYYFEKVVQVK